MCEFLASKLIVDLSDYFNDQPISDKLAIRSKEMTLRFLAGTQSFGIWTEGSIFFLAAAAAVLLHILACTG
jgi:hypothetical protein